VIHTRQPRAERRRHSRKYAEGNLGSRSQFFTSVVEGKLNLKAQNLHVFLQLADGVDDDTWEFHRQGGEFLSVVCAHR